MKAIYLNAIGAVALSFTIAACVPSSEPPSVATSAPATNSTPAPAPSPLPEPPKPAASLPPLAGGLAFLDAPQTQGNWRYIVERNETFALFGSSYENAQAIIRCDLDTRKVGIGRFGPAASAAQMRVRTETRSSDLRATTRNSGQPLVAAELDPRDPLLDAIALSKGRFALETAGMPALYLPAWAEVTRVIEDCR